MQLELHLSLRILLTILVANILPARWSEGMQVRCQSRCPEPTVKAWHVPNKERWGQWQCDKPQLFDNIIVLLDPEHWQHISIKAHHATLFLIKQGLFECINWLEMDADKPLGLATKRPEQRDWNLNLQSRKESWNTKSLDPVPKNDQNLPQDPNSEFASESLRPGALWISMDWQKHPREHPVRYPIFPTSFFKIHFQIFPTKKGQPSQPQPSEKPPALDLHALGIASKNPGQQGHPESQGLRWFAGIRWSHHQGITSESSKNQRFPSSAPLETNCLQHGNWPGRFPIFRWNLMSIHMEEKFLPKNRMFLFTMGNR